MKFDTRTDTDVLDNAWNYMKVSCSNSGRTLPMKSAAFVWFVYFLSSGKEI